MSLIDIRNLNFSYQSEKVEIPIFRDFNLKVDRGDFVAIKGPSGSGKSTLLYLIAGLLKYQSGEVYIEGEEVSSLSDIELSILRNKNIGFIFQQFHLLSKATVKENILLPTFYPIEQANRNKGTEEKGRNLAYELGIGERLDHRPNQLSGGQQQRVAIARALINDANIILADEPTGNLDSKSTEQIISILKDLNSKGKTIVLITHEDDVAQAASKIYHLKDGRIQQDKNDSKEENKNSERRKAKRPILSSSFQNYLKILPLAFSNAFRNKTRSILTMLGIIVGVAAVCSMVTLGNFTKEKMLGSFAELGVDTITFRGRQNWRLKATDQFSIKFRSFDWERDLAPLPKIFPEIELISPILSDWNTTISYAGKSMDNEGILMGTSENGLELLRRKLVLGKSLSRYHVERKYSVCVIGFEVGKRLFPNVSPIGEVIHLSQNESSFACKVLGVLEEKKSNKEWYKPNKQVFIPYTLFQGVAGNWWSSRIRQAAIRMKPGADIEKVGEGIRGFFERKYGKSGRFRIGYDSVLVAQMNKFLNLFSILLLAIALVTLTVGGMGITNMMLVSVSERLKEIGLRKSIGASNLSIRYQFLLESVVLCFFAGIIGILIGIGVYQGAIYAASNLTKKLEFSWVFDPVAISLSFASIIFVGVISGLAPAIKAERLQVIDALRSE